MEMEIPWEGGLIFTSFKESLNLRVLFSKTKRDHITILSSYIIRNQIPGLLSINGALRPFARSLTCLKEKQKLFALQQKTFAGNRGSATPSPLSCTPVPLKLKGVDLFQVLRAQRLPLYDLTVPLVFVNGMNISKNDYFFFLFVFVLSLPPCNNFHAAFTSCSTLSRANK